jgi:hypothetical protein
VDTTADKLQAYALNQWDRPKFKSGSRMSIVRWKALSEQATHIWDIVAEDDKALILVLQEKRKEAAESDQSKLSVNMHTVTLTPDAPPNNIDDVLLTMVTKHTNRSTGPSSHPGDIRSVLSQPTKVAKAQVQDLEIYVSTVIRMCDKSSLMTSNTVCPKPLAERNVLSKIEVPMEASQVLTQGSLNAIIIEWLVFVASILTMR